MTDVMIDKTVRKTIDQFDVEIHQMRKEMKAMHGKIKEKEEERFKYLISHVKDACLPLVGRAYKHVDGSFFFVKNWDDDAKGLIIINYLPIGVSIGGGFRIYSSETQDNDFNNRENTSEITIDEFKRSRERFLKEYEV